ncbi:Spc97/Spc98 [Auricularia subglabra TFB-10046 SS5]|nr:Spc97/Spc98 [Auricularia subglabra TFB-10046 SS5]
MRLKRLGRLQEALIIEDLLSVMMGIEGTYITIHPDYLPDDPRMQLKGARFVVSGQLDPSLRDFVARILPLSTYFTAISSFIELRGPLEYGLVNHALCAAMRDMLKDYHVLLSQLEHAFNTSRSFTLQKLWFYVHPTLHTLSLMYALISELAEADDPPVSSSDSDSDNDLDDALGIASGVKAVLSQLEDDGGIIKGGEVVAIIWQRMANMSGDPSARSLYGALLRRASRPYAEMLDAWITSGQLDDPHGELMVKESKFINRGSLDQDYTDEYWERRYTLRDGSTLAVSVKRQQAGVPRPRKVGAGRLPGGACVPSPLEPWKHKILLAGKYLNVIRECGIEVVPFRASGPTADDHLAIDEERFYKSIESAYTHANQTLLKLLLEDQQLILRLRTMRHFFFLCQSSFLTQFLDLAAGELRKSARSASIVKLQSLLDLALKDDSNPDLFKEDIKVSMASSGLYDWLLKVVSVSGAIGGGEGEGWDAHGMDMPADEGKEREREREKEKEKKPLLASDALTLDYAVKFPLSLVLSRKTILRYQLLFRFLLHLKHVELALGAMWTEHTQPVWRARGAPDDLERWRRRVFVLRARMLAFVQQILAFATSEVLEPHWRALERKLEKVTTVDQLLRDHVDFLDTCLKECMLTSSKLLRAYSRLVVTCSTFAVYTASFTKSATQALTEPEVTPMEKRWEFLSKFETNFNHWLKVFIDCVSFYSSTDNIQLLALVVRLNSVQTTAGS